MGIPGAAETRVTACARAQEAIWLAEQTRDIGAANNLPLTLQLDGPLEVEALREGLVRVVRAHPALRTRFAQVGARLVRTEQGAEQVGTDLLEIVESRDAEALVAERSRTALSLLEQPWSATLLRCGAAAHVLFANFHHAVFDGPSKEIFVHDLLRAYDDVRAGRASTLSERPSYDRYVALERAATEELRCEAERYWTRVLATIEDAVAFPRFPDADDAGSGECVEFEIGAELKRALDRVAAQHDVSLFAVLMAAVQGFQHAYDGRRGETIATLMPLGTRPPDMRDAIGMFVNEVPLVLGAPADEPAVDHMRRIASTLRDVARLRRFPFNEAMAHFAPAGDPHRLMPSFMVSYWKASGREPQVAGLRVAVERLRPVYGRRWNARFRFLEAHDRVVCHFEYDTSVMPQAAASRAAGHLETMLGDLARRPTVRASRLRLLPDRERERLVSEWNDTRVDYPPETLQELIEAQVERTPGRTAAIHEGASISYEGLNARANRLAHRLISAGAEPDRVVGICLGRGLDLLVAVLGVIKSGAGYVPLDPSYPTERLGFMLRDTRAQLLVCDRSTAGALQHEGTTVLVDDPPDTGEPATNPPVRARPSSLAYVIYTSGSTGEPKGTELVHSGVANLIRTLADEPGLGEDDIFLSVTTLSFDIGSAELLAPLTVGGRVVIAPTEAATDGEALARLLDTSGATIMFATPSRWRLAISGGWSGGQTVLVGGEALPSDVAAELLRRSDRVWNIYGPTETTIFSTRQRIRNPEAIAIGRPVANTTAYVVDAMGELVPPGVVGELWIGGAGVARGYVNRPELTQERFARDPFSAGEARIYRTGDLVRHREDGALLFVGRDDDQLKIRGFRVEPGEVAAALRALPRVEDAAVVALDEGAGSRLAAYLVPAEAAASVREMRAALGRRLPEFMIPAAFVGLDELPLNANGKVDRRRLPAPNLSGAPADAHVAPRTEREAKLAAIWSSVLGVDRIGIDDNFFELGGHSLLAAEVVARAREQFRTDVPMGMIFEAPTVGGMAAAIDDRQASQPAPRATRAPLGG